MDQKKAVAVALTALMVGTVIAFTDDKHLHVDARAEFPRPTKFVAGAAPTFLDEEAFAPAMPWASWLPGFKFPEHLISYPAQLMMAIVSA